VDADSDMDVVAATLTNNALVWYENQGSSSESPPNVAWVQHPIANVPQAHKVVAAHANADGNIDILFHGDSGPAFFINVPGPPRTWALLSFQYNPSVVAAFPADIGQFTFIACPSENREARPHIAFIQQQPTRSYRDMFSLCLGWCLFAQMIMGQWMWLRSASVPSAGLGGHLWTVPFGSCTTSQPSVPTLAAWGP
jgi:hypothetical protein